MDNLGKNAVQEIGAGCEGGGCFVAGTEVITGYDAQTGVDSETAIQNILVGDQVESRNQDDPNGPMELETVTAVEQHVAYDLRDVTIQGSDGSTETIQATEEHCGERMQKIFELVPEDICNGCFVVFFYDKKDGHLKHRPEYLDLVCPVCRKFDESAAVRRYLGPDIRVKTTKDYVLSSDGLVIASERFKTLIQGKEIIGVEFQAIPKAPGYFVVVPTIKAHVDIATSGRELHNQCPKCGRFEETCFTPLLRSITIPPMDGVIFGLDQPTEKGPSAMYFLFTTETVVDVLRAKEIKGVEYHEVR